MKTETKNKDLGWLYFVILIGVAVASAYII